MTSPLSNRIRAGVAIAGVVLLAAFLRLELAAQVTPDAAASTTPGAVVIRPADSPEPVQLYRESHALLVGMSDYQRDGWEDLRDVRPELEKVRGALKAHGFQFFEDKVHFDLGEKALRDLMERFIDGPGRKRSARIVVFLSGHGFSRRLENQRLGYFVPVDAPHPNLGLSAFESRAIEDSDFLAWAYRVRSRHSLFLFDSCFSGAFLTKTKSGAVKIPPQLQRRVENSFCRAFTAGGANEEVPTPSVFTRSFVEALTTSKADVNGDGYVTGLELQVHLTDRVSVGTVRSTRNTVGVGRVSKSEQEGDMVFAVGGPRAPTSEPVPGAPPIEVMKGVLWVSTEEAAWVSVGGSQEYELGVGRVAKYEGDFVIPVGEQVVRARAKRDGATFEQRVVVGATDRAEVVIRFARGVRLPEDLEAVEGAEYASLTGLAAGSREAQERQRAEAKRLGLPLEVKNKRTGMVFRFVPAGEYTMGSPAGEADRDDDDETQRRVRIPRGLYVGKYEVTQAEWKGLMGSNPSDFKGVGPRGPVEQVSAKQCDDYVGRLGKGYRLLTEEEWEYACRGGTSTPFCFGESLSSVHANFDGRYPYGGASKGQNLEKTAPVGSYQANSWGLYDMHGNVYEWTSSLYDGGPFRVFRGGGWLNFARSCRSASRSRLSPDDRDGSLGFRVARVLPEAE